MKANIFDLLCTNIKPSFLPLGSSRNCVIVALLIKCVVFSGTVRDWQETTSLTTLVSSVAGKVKKIITLDLFDLLNDWSLIRFLHDYYTFTFSLLKTMCRESVVLVKTRRLFGVFNEIIRLRLRSPKSKKWLKNGCLYVCMYMLSYHWVV